MDNQGSTPFQSNQNQGYQSQNPQTNRNNAFFNQNEYKSKNSSNFPLVSNRQPRASPNTFKSEFTHERNPNGQYSVKEEQFGRTADQSDWSHATTVNLSNRGGIKGKMNGNNDDFDEDEWIEGAVKCKEKKHTKIRGNMKITKIVKVFLMRDGKTEIIENTLRELI